MQRNIAFLLSSILLALLSSDIANAQFNKIKASESFLNSLNYNILIWEEDKTDYKLNNFYPLQIVYGSNDTTYSVVRSDMISASETRVLFYYVPEKVRSSMTPSIFRNDSQVDFRQTKAVFDEESFISKNEVIAVIEDYEKNLRVYTKLLGDNKEYKDYAGTLALASTLLYGLLIRNSIRNVQNDKHPLLNKVVGYSSFTFLTLSYSFELSDFFIFRKNKKTIKRLEGELNAYN